MSGRDELTGLDGDADNDGRSRSSSSSNSSSSSSSCSCSCKRTSSSSSSSNETRVGLSTRMRLELQDEDWLEGVDQLQESMRQQRRNDEPMGRRGEFQSAANEAACLDTEEELQRLRQFAVPMPASSVSASSASSSSSQSSSRSSTRSPSGIDGEESTRTARWDHAEEGDETEVGSAPPGQRYHGVHYDSSRGGYVAVLWHNGRCDQLGVFSTGLRAALAHDIRAESYFGPSFSEFNFPIENDRARLFWSFNFSGSATDLPRIPRNADEAIACLARIVDEDSGHHSLCAARSACGGGRASSNGSRGMRGHPPAPFNPFGSRPLTSPPQSSQTASRFPWPSHR